LIVPDVNLLLYANVDTFAQHGPARSWFESALNADEPVALASPAVFGFIRVATNPRVFDPAMRVDDAVARVESWLAQPHVNLLVPGPRYLDIAFRLLRQLSTAGNLTSDVQLAAHAIENQAELYSNDTDFGRFPGLRWVNPLS
jgi:toxin-antitoxin system PIN domain toxin